MNSKNSYSKLLKSLAKLYKVDANDLIVRVDGRVEWICEHGVGHPVYSPRQSEADFIHGCDGCCSRFRKDKNDKH